VNAYQQAFTQKTRLVQVTHMINWIGQILPAKKIAQAAHARGIDVLLDGAQTFAHIDFKISDTECDYFGTSLHKWLGCPFGTGLIYVRKEKIKYIWPLFASPEPLSDNIRKFEALGTRSFPAEHAIGQAIKFHNMIGSKRKEERFRFLKNYWTKKVAKIPRITVHSPIKPEYSCGIALFSIEGMAPADVQSALFKKYGIHTVSIVWENISGVRVSPNLYNTTKELDVLVKGIEEIAKT
jgi:selenocysteine lyase/cysteine desulfurase